MWLCKRDLSRECEGKYRDCTDCVLDKIRAEIHATAEMHEDGVYYLRDEWIDEIIDKYTIESESQESDLGDYPDAIHNQFDNMTGSMNL